MRVVVIKGCPEGVDHRAEGDKVYWQRYHEAKAEVEREQAEKKEKQP